MLKLNDYSDTALSNSEIERHILQAHTLRSELAYDMISMALAAIWSGFRKITSFSPRKAEA